MVHISAAIFIHDGIKNEHSGFYPESAIEEGMHEYLNLVDDGTIDLCERLLLSHFMIETIHPFYDGNGRLDRLLYTMAMFQETGSYLSFAASAALKQRKSAYYKAFAQARDQRMVGSLNAFVEEIGAILHASRRCFIN